MKPLPQPRKTPRQERSKAMVEFILESTARVLADRGYAGTNTNVVAERAGVGVGSIYQYFPNKDALVTALHERHADQMYQVINDVLTNTHPESLQGHIEAIVHAWLEAHNVEPTLHKVLEKEFPFLDAPRDQSPADATIFCQMRQILQVYEKDIVQRDLDLATWTILRIIETLIHAAVIDPPVQFCIDDIEQSIVDAVIGYLLHASESYPSPK